ncbi:hypothetical protein IQ06DRAFT_202502, partial [Phaeosphaeriaceae sp. SRC1lsM3a]
LIDLHMQCAEGRFPALKQVHLIWRLLSAPMYFAFDVENVRDIYATGQIRFNITVHCSEGMKPAPLILSRYKELFPAYVRYKHHTHLGRHVQQRHFVQASTCYRSEEEHERLMTGVPPW